MDPDLIELAHAQWDDALVEDAIFDARQWSPCQGWEHHYAPQAALPSPYTALRFRRRKKKTYAEKSRHNGPPLRNDGIIGEDEWREAHCELTAEQWREVEAWNTVMVDFPWPVRLVRHRQRREK